MCTQWRNAGRIQFLSWPDAFLICHHRLIWYFLSSSEIPWSYHIDLKILAKYLEKQLTSVYLSCKGSTLPLKPGTPEVQNRYQCPTKRIFLKRNELEYISVNSILSHKTNYLTSKDFYFEAKVSTRVRVPLIPLQKKRPPRPAKGRKRNRNKEGGGTVHSLQESEFRCDSNKWRQIYQSESLNISDYVFHRLLVDLTQKTQQPFDEINK